MYKVKPFVLYFLILLYSELIFKFFIFKDYFNVHFISTILYLVVVALIYGFITKLFYHKTNKRIFITLVFANLFWYGMQFVLYKFFSLFFTFNMSDGVGQIIGFYKHIPGVLYKYKWGIFLYLLPFIIILICREKLLFYKSSNKEKVVSLTVIFVVLFVFLFSLNYKKDNEFSQYKLFYKLNDINLTYQELGVKIGSNLDLVKTITGFEEKVTIVELPIIKEAKVEKEAEEKIKYNIFDVDFVNLKKDYPKLKETHDYIENDTGTNKNEYTGMFKGKNVIMILAESHSNIAVDEERTPTLYKMIHEGIHFTNYYTPEINSTIGGETQYITSLYPQNYRGFQRGENEFPYSIAKNFQNEGYNTFAFHPYKYRFQKRNLYLTNIGFDNFLACGNGLEKQLRCRWTTGDVELFEKTIDDYINSDKLFFTYYVTLNGHSGYAMFNWQAVKYKSLVNHLPYTGEVKAYLATQIELDRGLERLLEMLNENNKLKDTVIVLAADHYPYAIKPISDLLAVSTYKRDSIDLHKNSLIIYNSDMKSIEVDKVGSTIDVVPTVFNLFDIKYDSRFFIGKDILSDEPGLAMFNNRSWVSDYGKYFARSRKFVSNEDVELPEDYVSIMNQVVKNKISISSQIFKNDYYKVIKNYSSS